MNTHAPSPVIAVPVVGLACMIGALAPWLWPGLLAPSVFVIGLTSLWLLRRHGVSAPECRREVRLQRGLLVMMMASSLLALFVHRGLIVYLAIVASLAVWLAFVAWRGILESGQLGQK